MSTGSIKLLRYQVAKEGFGISFVFDGFPFFAYTVGLEETFDHPELLVAGLDFEGSRKVLTDLISLIREGSRMDGEESLHRAGGVAVLVAAVPRAIASERFAAAAEYYGDRSYRVVQALWPDEKGFFPADENCSEAVRAQQTLFQGPA